MHKDHHIEIRELTRVEGHGNIVIDIRKGTVREIRLEIIESPRFFEALIKGRHYQEVPHIISRICGICSASHTCASLKAVEDALGMRISRRTGLLRELCLCAETIQSHILHLYFLVLPDFVGTHSVLPLLRENPSLMEPGLKLKGLANHISTILNGRPVHPISLVPGGTLHMPEKGELIEMKERLEEATELLHRVWETFRGFSTPGFEKAREFISLKPSSGYGMYDGTPFSNIDGFIEKEDYAHWLEEHVVPHSTAKHARTRHGAYMVGALARLNNNHRRLMPLARSFLRDAPFSIPCHIPFMNNLAQVIECVHLAEYATELIDRLLDVGLEKEPPRKGTTWGRGTGMVEAPRGILYHSYTINSEGLIESANCIIPTAQNLSSIEEDLKGLVPGLLPCSREEIVKGVEGLVRAYDPCISCSTHIMDVEFV